MVCGVFNDCEGDAGFTGGCKVYPNPEYRECYLQGHIVCSVSLELSSRSKSFARGFGISHRSKNCAPKQKYIIFFGALEKDIAMM